MLRIGDFAQLSRVSPKALRLYDRLGLLKPVKVDIINGYRYYSAIQLTRLNRILVFKELGFSLEQIKRLLDENISAEEIRGMLRLRRSEIRQRLEEDKTRLLRVEMRLQELQQEKSMSNYEVIIKPSPSQLVAATLGVIPNYQDCGAIFDRLFDLVYNYASIDTPTFTLRSLRGILPSQGSSQTYPSRSLDGMPYRHSSTVHHYLGCCYISISCVPTFRTEMNSFRKLFFASYSLTSGASLTC